uniref:hypothetical protein n=1 Tax=Vibrio parahaemolyticus TaxID=670 RepID=UPI002111E267
CVKESKYLYYVGLILVGVGVCIGLLNWPLSIRRILMRRGPSSIPLVGMVIMVLGVLLMPEKTLIKLIWLAPVIDFSCLPLFAYGLIAKKI